MDMPVAAPPMPAPMAPPPAPPVAPPAAVAKPVRPVNWRKRIAACDTLRDKKLKSWQLNVDYRKGKPLSSTPDTDTVVVPVDWSRTKNKQAQLFYQVPEVKLRARQPQYVGAAPLFGAALNFELENNLRIEFLMDEVLGDVINAAGIGIAMIGYEATTEDVPVPTMDTASRSPEELALLQQSGQMPVEPTPRTVYECYTATHIDPALFLWPSEFVESDWQKAPWLGYKGRVALADAIRQGWVEEGDRGDGDSELESVNAAAEDKDQNPVGRTVGFSEIFYRPYFTDPNEKDPRKIRRVILVDGKDEPAVDEDLKWQQYDGATGQWIGLTSLPIKVLTLTTISGEAIPPSDSEIGRAQVREMTRSRSQMLTQRDRSLPIRWFDVNLVDPDIAAQMSKGVYQDMVPMNGPGENAIGEVARASFPRETFEFMEVIERDLDQAWSMGPNQQGVATPGDTSATEANIIQGSANVRTEYERARVLRFFLEMAEGIGALMQLFQTDEKFAEVIGENGVKSLQPWDRTAIRGDYIFEAKPDAALRLDVGQKRAESLNLYKMVRRDPLLNATALLTEVLQLHGMDPSQFLVPQAPPSPKPPVIRYSFASADFSNPIVVALAQKTDTPITPDDLKAAQKLMLDAGIPLLPPQTLPMPKAESVLPPGAMAAVDAAGQPPQAEHPGPPESVNPINRRYERDGTQDAVPQ